MTTSTPPAWNWLHECYVPFKTPELSFDARKLPDSDALRERNDSYPDQCANGEQTPQSAPVPSDQCPDCNGEGLVWRDLETPGLKSHEYCPACHGTGVNAAPEHVESCVSGGRANTRRT